MGLWPPPWPDLTRALSAAATSTKKDVYLPASSLTSAIPVTLPNAVSMFGGYGAASAGGSSYGLHLTNTGTLTLDRVTIRAGAGGARTDGAAGAKRVAGTSR